MGSRDHIRLAKALAKASVQPRISAATIEQCVYQIGLVLPREARPFDLPGGRGGSRGCSKTAASRWSGSPSIYQRRVLSASRQLRNLHYSQRGTRAGPRT